VENLSIQKISTNQKWLKQNPPSRKLSIVHQREQNVFPQINQNSKLRNLQNAEKVQDAHNQSLDRIYNVTPKK